VDYRRLHCRRKTSQRGVDEQGVTKVEKLLGIENLYDPAFIEMNHHVQQSLRAHVLYSTIANTWSKTAR